MKKFMGLAIALVAGVAFAGNVYAEQTCTDNCAAEINGTKYDTLDNALNAATEGQTVKVLRKIDVGNGGVPGPSGEANGYVGRLEEKDTINFTLDLNGQIITSANPNKATLILVDGDNLTIIDSSEAKTGKIENTAGKQAIFVQKGTLTLEGGEFKSTDTATFGTIQVGSINSTTSGILTVKDGVKITGNYGILYLYGSTVNIEGGEITSSAFALSGNGTDTQINTVNVKGGTLTSEDDAAIYQPSKTNMTISGGTITGKIGIVARRGTVEITDGKIIANGDADSKGYVGDAKENGENVELPYGVGIIVDNKSEGYESDGKVTVKGGEFDTQAEPVASYDDDKNDIEVIGGKFNQDVDKKYISEGLVQNEDGTVGEETPESDPEEENPKDDVSQTGDVVALSLMGIITLGLSGTYVLKKLHE